MKKNKIPILTTAFKHKCPSCGRGDIYERILEVKSKCNVCGQRLKDHDAGDGPVFFAMFISGILITSLAFFVEIYLMIPLVLHIIIWLPVTIGLSIFLLKITKSWLIAMQYLHKIGDFKNSDKK